MRVVLDFAPKPMRNSGQLGRPAQFTQQIHQFVAKLSACSLHTHILDHRDEADDKVPRVFSEGGV